MSENYSSNLPQQGDSERQLLVKILKVLGGSSSGGGGVGLVQGASGNYGGVQPNWTPTSSFALALDTSNSRQWTWNGTIWQ